MTGWSENDGKKNESHDNSNTNSNTDSLLLYFIYRSFSKISKNNDMLKIEIKYFISYLVQRKNLLYFYEERKKKTIKFQ